MIGRQLLASVNRAVHYCETSLLFNWAVIPIFAGLVTSLFNLGDRVGIADAARHAKAYTVAGTLNRAGHKQRDLVVVNPLGSRLNVTCGAYYNTGSCVSPKYLFKDVKVDLFSFKKDKVILEVRDARGEVLIGRAEREDQLAGVDQNARADSAGSKFVLGALLGLLVAAGRYFLFVRRRRHAPNM